VEKTKSAKKIDMPAKAPPEKNTKAKPIHPGLEALRTSVLRNIDAEPKGSKYISGYAASDKEARQIASFLDGEGYKTEVGDKRIYFSLATQRLNTSPDQQSVQLYPIRIESPKGKPINLDAFAKKLGVKIHRLSFAEGEEFDVSATAAFEAAVKELATRLASKQAR
jgi:hypothetical protein